MAGPADTDLSMQGLLNKAFDPSNNSFRVSGSGDTLFLQPKNFEILTATPAYSVANGIQSWEMDAAATEAVSAGQVLFPVFWRTVACDVFYGKRNATASLNIRHRVSVKQLASADLFTEADFATATSTVTIGAQNAVTKQDNALAVTLSADQLYVFSYERLGADGADTFTADSSFFGLRLRRTS